jgi:hypothetical protein
MGPLGHLSGPEKEDIIKCEAPDTHLVIATTEFNCTVAKVCHQF